jgi:hypothetical protein
MLAMVMAPAMALSVGVLAAPQTADAAGKANCRVHAVLASKEGDGKIPKSLEFLRETLEDDQFAAYKSFHLVDKKTLKLEGDTPSKATFSSGHKLGLKLLESTPKLKLHLELSSRDGSKNLVKTDYSIDNNGMFMIGAGKLEQGEIAGKLFFAIQCKT